MPQATYLLPDTLSADIKKFAQLTEGYKKGSVTPTEFKAFRVPMGVYEQRKNGVYMVRIRATGGLIRPGQLLRVIEIAQNHRSNLLHITTRGEIQIQNLDVDELEAILLELQAEKLSSKGGGGNTVRNILVSQWSGIGMNEVFDPTPYAVALTSKMVAEPDSYLMPRKLKLAFQEDADYINFAAINDIGLVAKMQDGKKGFEVYVGGGIGGKPTVGHKLYDFMPVEDLYALVKGVKQFFSDHGNRKNRHQARLRFVFYKNGVERTLQDINTYVERAKQLGIVLQPADLGEERPAVDYTAPAEALKIVEAEADLYALWQQRYVSKQRQEGYVTVFHPVFLGNINLSDQSYTQHFQALVHFAARFGENTLRFTPTQGIRLRNIPEAALSELYSLVRWFKNEAGAPVIVNKLQSCTGADTCRLGLALSKGLATAVRKALLESSLDLDLLANATIHITGCPNSCGQQLWADLGFAGNPLRKAGRSLPGYKVFLQANRTGDVHLGETIGTINARDLPQFVVRLLAAYQPHAPKQSFHDYLATEAGRGVAEYLLAQFQDFPSFEEDKNYYFDWGAEELFTVTPRGKAECSAGLFDMINVDLDSIADAKKHLAETADREKRSKLVHSIVFSAARMLLVTRGLDPREPLDVFPLFADNFISTGYVPESYRSLIREAHDTPDADFADREEEAAQLAEVVTALYRSMDDSLQFKKPVETPVKDVTSVPQDTHSNVSSATDRVGDFTIDLVKDFRGVACPMNFVKTKLALAPLHSGNVLEIWLDDGEPINNVPGSVKLEGHTILLQQQTADDYWRVVIKKK